MLKNMKSKPRIELYCGTSLNDVIITSGNNLDSAVEALNRDIQATLNDVETLDRGYKFNVSNSGRPTATQWLALNTNAWIMNPIQSAQLCPGANYQKQKHVLP